MTVKELIATLQAHDPAALVVLAKDREGNRYSPLDVVDRGHYVEDTTWAGEFHPLSPSWSFDGIPAVCLWPVN